MYQDTQDITKLLKDEIIWVSLKITMKLTLFLPFMIYRYLSEN